MLNFMYFDNVNAADLFDPDVLLEPIDLNSKTESDQDLVLDLFQNSDSLCAQEETKPFDSPQHVLSSDLRDLNTLSIHNQQTSGVLKSRSLESNVQQIFEPNVIRTQTDTLQLPTNINLMQYSVNQTSPIAVTSAKPINKVLIQPTSQKKRILPSNDVSITSDLIRIIKEQDKEKQILLQHLSQMPQQKVQQVNSYLTLI